MRQLQSSTFLAICLASLKCFLINIILINHAAIYYNHTEFEERIVRGLSPRMDNFECRDRKRGAFFGLFFLSFPKDPLLATTRSSQRCPQLRLGGAAGPKCNFLLHPSHSCTRSDLNATIPSPPSTFSPERPPTPPAPGFVPGTRR